MLCPSARLSLSATEVRRPEIPHANDMSAIHPTAIVEDGADVHASVRIGPYSIVESGAVIGEGCVIESSARIYGHTRMGRRNRVGHGAVIGAEPQDLKYTEEASRPLTIGDENRFKEGAHISRGVNTEAGTVIGDRNYFMGASHVGHDSRVGSDNVIGHGTALAGHVELEHHVVLGGVSAVHQFARVGAYAMMAGVSAVIQDLPPYLMAVGMPGRIHGINVVGLRRAGFSEERRREIKRVYRMVYRSGLRIDEALAALEAEEVSEDVERFIVFVRSSERGIASHR